MKKLFVGFVLMGLVFGLSAAMPFGCGTNSASDSLEAEASVELVADSGTTEGVAKEVGGNKDGK